jgi:hypothetical protein
MIVTRKYDKIYSSHLKILWASSRKGAIVRRELGICISSTSTVAIINPFVF